MKQFLLLNVTLLITYLAFGQEKIEGIGKFKIGKSDTTQLYSFAKEQNMDVVQVFTVREQWMYTRTKVVQRLNSNGDPKSLEPSFYSFCPETVVFYLPKYVVADIEMNELYLYYYQNTLVKIQIYEPSRLSSALELKYGEPKITSWEGEDKVKLSASEDEIKLKNKTYCSSWTNGPITAYSLLTDGHNEDGKREMSAIFSMESVEKQNASRICDQLAKEEAKKKQNAAAAEKLADL